MLKNYIFSITIVTTFLLSNLYAGKIILKDGTVIQIPDKLRIYNDLNESVYIEEKVEEALALSEGQKRLLALCAASNVETRRITSCTLSPNADVEIAVNKAQKSLESHADLPIVVNGNRYKLVYPTYCHPEGLLMAIETVFDYKASDILNEKYDERGLTVTIS